MEEILKKISMLDYNEFRERAMKECGWTAEVFRNKKSNRTKVTAAELQVLEQITKEFNK